MNGNIVNPQPLCNTSGNSKLKDFIQRSDRVNVQNVYNQHDCFTVTIIDLHLLIQEMRKIYCRLGVGQPYHSLASQWFKCNE